MTNGKFYDALYQMDPDTMEQIVEDSDPCPDCDIPEDGSCFRDCPNLGTNYDDMSNEV